MKLETVNLGQFGRAYIIDNTIPDETIRQIEKFRASLPLDNKRPTVDRRFFADWCETTHRFFEGVSCQDRPLAFVLEDAVKLALSDTETVVTCHVLRYMRFLEYNRPGQGLEPHTDGTKICQDTGLVSTHTMLLYLTQLESGGETILMINQNTAIMPVKARVGRILLFPHRAWHEGAPVVDVPKICLRSEVHLEILSKKDVI